MLDNQQISCPWSQRHFILDSPKSTRQLTKFGTSHEVVTGLFGVFAVHLASLGVKLGEHVAVEAVVVLHEAEGRRAVWHGFKLLLVHSLGFYVEVEDFVPCGEKDYLILIDGGPLMFAIQQVIPWGCILLAPAPI